MTTKLTGSGADIEKRPWLRKLLGPAGPPMSLADAYDDLDDAREHLKGRIVDWARWLLLVLFAAAAIAAVIGWIFGQDVIPAWIVGFLALPSVILDLRDRITGHTTVSGWLRHLAGPIEGAVHRRQMQRLFRLYGPYELAKIVQADPGDVTWFSPDRQIYRRRRRWLAYATVVALFLAGTSVWLWWPAAGEKPVDATFRLGTSLQVKVNALSCRHGDQQTGQPDTCTADVEFTNVGHVRARIKAPNTISVGSS